MSILSNYKLEYEDMPRRKKITLKEGKTIMSKSPKTTEPKAAKVYAPSRLEVFKTVLIAVMFAAIIAFVAGMNFQKSHDIEIQKASAAAIQAPATEAKK